MLSFDRQLAFGQVGESAIAQWIRSRGGSVLPAYEKEIDTGKGPRLFCAKRHLVTPDLFVFPNMVFIEAKHKSVFTWHHKTGAWCTGIDLHHYLDYQEVARETGRPIWLMFLHRSAEPDAIDLRGRADCGRCMDSASGSCCPSQCPTGLFGAPLKLLVQDESHRHQNHGRHGMVYWRHRTLKFFAPISHIDALQSGAAA